MIIEYKIYPTIAYDGTPTYSLFTESSYSPENKHAFGVLGAITPPIESIKIAENTDKSVLEKAIEHLKNAT